MRNEIIVVTALPKAPASLLALVAVAAGASALLTQPVDFEVASVRQGMSHSEWVERIRHLGNVQAPWGIRISGRQVHVEGISMKGLISEAYGIDTRLIAGPSWVTDGDITYEVDAMMPDGATKDQLPAMFQSLLTKRFHFSFHRETVPQLGYALVPAKGELKLMPPGNIDPSACPEWQSPGSDSAATGYQSCRRLDELGDERVQTVIWRDSHSDRPQGKLMARSGMKSFTGSLWSNWRV